jgi:hypothetical protein
MVLSLLKGAAYTAVGTSAQRLGRYEQRLHVNK